jgi:hypothetical protein
MNGRCSPTSSVWGVLLATTRKRWQGGQFALHARLWPEAALGCRTGASAISRPSTAWFESDLPANTAMPSMPSWPLPR